MGDVSSGGDGGCGVTGSVGVLVFKQHGDGATTDGAFKEWAM